MLHVGVCMPYVGVQRLSAQLRASNDVAARKLAFNITLASLLPLLLLLLLLLLFVVVAANPAEEADTECTEGDDVAASVSSIGPDSAAELAAAADAVQCECR
jgi:hypothetical protein